MKKRNKRKQATNPGTVSARPNRRRNVAFGTSVSPWPVWRLLLLRG